MSANINDLDEKKIPKAVVKRLSLYSRVLQGLELQKIEKVSSSELASRLGLNSAQVRKDLAYFGQFGVPGFGYYVADLRKNIKRILGTDREIHVALVGVGNLGRALLTYGGFGRQGCHILMAFDLRAMPAIEGSGAPIHAIDELEARLAERPVEIAIMAVPPEVAQGIADRLVAAGIPAILNFVPTRLDVPPAVKVHYVDLAIEMESLSFYVR